MIGTGKIATATASGNTLPTASPTLSLDRCRSRDDVTTGRAIRGLPLIRLTVHPLRVLVISVTTRASRTTDGGESDQHPCGRPHEPEGGYEHSPHDQYHQEVHDGPQARRGEEGRGDAEDRGARARPARAPARAARGAGHQARGQVGAESQL